MLRLMAFLSLGSSDVNHSIQAGTISYKASERDQRRISDMIQKIGVNASVVSMQVAIINVSLDRERNTGFDWNSLKMGIGAQELGVEEEPEYNYGNNNDPLLGAPPQNDEEEISYGNNL